MRDLSIFVCTLLLSLGACGGKSPAPADPANEEVTGDEPGEGTGDPEAVDRSAEECQPVLDHIQSVVVEAIDQDGMMEACQHEWSPELTACLGDAQDDGEVEACW